MVTDHFGPLLRDAACRLRRFARSEAGVMAPMVLIFFFLMLLVGGVAVDVMRFETRRVAVQNTMDRATLAAASLRQELDPEDVVHDYFAKAGLGQELDSVRVTEGMNYRIVKADATVISDNYFMSMMEVPTLQGANVSEAEQRITNIEIALVLDVSGSMYNSYSRITNLKSAAKNFVDKVLTGDDENKISIAIVPYNGQVNIGPDLYAKFTKSGAHSYPNSYCLDLPTSTYSSTTLSRITAYPQTPFGDSWSGTTQQTSYLAIQAPSFDSSRGLYGNVWCQPVAANYVRPFGNNRTTLKSQIDGLVAIGATSIDLGMKWGTFLLDPSSRSINAELADAGKVASYFRTRPAPYDDTETLKVVVLMTDGENFTQERFGDTFRGDPSPIWKSTKDGYLSIYHDSKVDYSSSTTIAASKPFWVPHRGTWQTQPWNGTAPGTTVKYVPTASYTGVNRLTWNGVWQIARTDWVAWQMYARALCTTSSCRSSTYNSWETAFADYTDTGTMDTRLNTVCSTAKAQGVLVYGIAFEATSAGATAIKNCASKPSSNFFFDVIGAELDIAFTQIASNLSQLRLTQ
ncbi:Tad domain-containing protein [Xinfangfangia pollutisoli]|uniref:Tad domain-containing protein n=1 Tax=Xinfangfangia pollutisoli TaxID=2865960 RepID=UPI001CD75F15|nr:Tad domain-containing protein [Xinfangfangia pollutisoli]